MDSETNRFLALVERYIDEKIRSDKVVEGILRDIQNSTDRIASELEDENQRLDNLVKKDGCEGLPQSAEDQVP